MKIVAEIIPTSGHNQSIFVMRKPDDSRFAPSVSLQMPTDIAEYLKGLVDQDQKNHVSNHDQA